MIAALIVAVVNQELFVYVAQNPVFRGPGWVDVAKGIESRDQDEISSFQ